MTSSNGRDDDTGPGPDASSDTDFDWDESAPDDLRADLEQRRSRRPGVLTMVLMALILVAGGFALGAVVGRNSASASASSAGPGAFPTGGAIPGSGEIPGGGVPTGGAGFPGGGGGLPGGGGSGGGFPGGGGFTAGTIERIQGDTVYVRTSDGKTVKVNTSPSTNVNITKQGAISDLAKGQTVTVIGTQDDSGSIEAVQISEGGGFPGGGFPGGGFPGAPGASPAPSSAP